MACYYPMDAVVFEDGSVKVLGSSGQRNDIHIQDGHYLRHIQVPCGKCIGCRLEYSRQWAIRCMKELETTQGQSWFLTLTYDNDHLPRKVFEEEASGVRVEMPTLKPKDLQDFVKRLREKLRRRGHKEPFRFFACGEYGDELKRPHYHMIAFNLPLDDLVFYKAIKGHEYYNSEFLDECWNNQGFVVASDVNFECCAYVARYVMKKAKGPDGFSYASDNNLEEEFVRMSRRPGIGRDYYELHKSEIYGHYDPNFKQYYLGYDNIGYQHTLNGSILLKPAKYYDKLFDVESTRDHLLYEKIKARRAKKSERVNQLKMANTSVSSREYRGILERDKQQQTTLLKRELDI